MKEIKKCAVENCAERHHARGLCNKHYRKLKYSERKKLIENTESCLHKDCYLPVHARGYCFSHYLMKYKSKHINKTSKPCSLEGCTNNLYKHNLCKGHLAYYTRLKKYRSFNTVEEFIEYMK